MFNLGMGEIIIVILLALIFLGPKKLPELASGLGRMIRELRKATAGVKDELHIDEAIRKPFEELREAVAMPVEELRRIDLERQEIAEARRKAVEGTGATPYGPEPAPPAGGEQASSSASPPAGASPAAPAAPGGAPLERAMNVVPPSVAAQLPPPPPASRPVPPPLPRRG